MADEISVLSNQELQGVLLATDVPVLGGAVLTFTLFSSGTGYTTGTYTTIGGSGTGLIVDVAAYYGGEGFEIQDEGTGYDDYLIMGFCSPTMNNMFTPGVPGPDAYSVSGGTGTGFIVYPEFLDGSLVSFEQDDTDATGYVIGDVVTLDGGNDDATLVYTGDDVGEIQSIMINDAGSSYRVGNQVIVNSGDTNAIIVVDTVSATNEVTDTNRNTYKYNHYFLNGGERN